MADIIELTQANTSAFLDKLRDAVQSARLNFLMGAGASAPTIKMVGDVEAQIDALTGDGNIKEATKVAAEFLAGFTDVTKELQAGDEGEEVAQNLAEYVGFLNAIESTLVERQNSLLVRQATIFSTNYDLYLERASDFLPNLILNDGFDRRPSLSGRIRFRSEKFFDSVFHTGRRYEYRAELPSINLVELHGFLSWQPTETGFEFQNWDTSAVDAAALIGGDDSDHAIVSSAGVILPSLAKHQLATLEETYYEQLRIFANELDVENCLLISFGFSFSDRHITTLLKRALRNPTLWLVIPCYFLDDAERIEQTFAGFHNVSILKPSTHGEFNFSWLNVLLARLTNENGNSND